MSVNGNSPERVDAAASNAAAYDTATLRWTLVAMTLTSGTFFLSGSVVSVALPAIDSALGAGLAGLQWIINGYLLTLSVLMIPAGSLGDRYGRKRVMLIGLTMFGVMAFAAALAPSVSWLIGARLLQGVGAAMMVPGALATLRAVFVTPESRGEAIGYWSGWSGVALIIGPLLGGWLIDLFSWRWAFFVQLPLIALTIWLMIRYVPETIERGTNGRLDWAGAALAAIGLGGISFGLIEGPVMGWGSAPVVGSLVAGVVGLALFVLVEARVAAPMMPLALFSVQNFYGSNLTTLAVYGALEAMLFFLVLYVQSIMGYSALASGLLFVPISLFLLLLSPFFGRMSGRHGPRLFMTLGPIVAGLGILLLLRLEPDSGFWLGPVPGIVIFSLGLTVLVAPLTTTVMSSIRSEHSGVAAGINEVVARIAGLITIASLGVVLTLGFNAGLRARLNDPAAAPQAAPLAGETVDPNAAVAELDALPAETRDAVLASYTAAFRWVMLSNAILTIAGGVIAWLVIRNPPPEPVQG